MTERDRGRPVVTARTAARRLGIEQRLVHGLMTGGQLAGYWSTGKSGQRVALVYEDAVQQLAARVERMTPR